MSLCGVAHPLRLEQLARRLTGKRSDQAWSGCSREGNTPREALFPPRFPPLDVIAEIRHLFEYPRTGIILKCDVSGLPTRNRCMRPITTPTNKAKKYHA